MKHFCWRKSNCLKLTCNRKHFILILIVCLGKSVCCPSGNKSNVKSRSFFRIFFVQVYSCEFVFIFQLLSISSNFVLVPFSCCLWLVFIQKHFNIIIFLFGIVQQLHLIQKKVRWASSKKVIFSLFCLASFNQNTVLPTYKTSKVEKSEQSQFGFFSHFYLFTKSGKLSQTLGGKIWCAFNSTFFYYTQLLPFLLILVQCIKLQAHQRKQRLLLKVVKKTATLLFTLWRKRFNDKRAKRR